jgi:putative phage-type endonuclease
MGKSKYKTRYQLWLDKTLGPQPEKTQEGSQFIRDLGHHFEPKALNHFALLTGLDAEPELFEHRDHPWLRASLDGWIKETKQSVEIKYVGLERFNWVKQNQSVLEDHFPQVQHQHMVSGSETGFYICYTLTPDKKQMSEIVVVETKANKTYIEQELFPALQDFWQLVQTGKPPKLSPKDEAIIEDPEALSHAELYSQLLAEKKRIEALIAIHESALKKEALKLEAGKIKVGKLSMTVAVRKGSVDYGKVPELQGLDLEPYRKPSTKYVTIRG